MKITVGIPVRMTVSLVAGAILCGCANDRSVRVYEPPPGSNMTDAKVQRFIAADPLLKGKNIKVNTFQGEVKLDGTVETEEQRQQAGKLAWSVSGVRGVENNLLLGPEKKH